MFVPTLPFPRYMVDAADQEKIEASKNELHNLLDKPQLQGIPVSGLGAGPEAGGGGVQRGCRSAPCLLLPWTQPLLPPLQVLVLGNKRDLPGALDEKELIEKM